MSVSCSAASGVPPGRGPVGRDNSKQYASDAGLSAASKNGRDPRGAVGPAKRDACFPGRPVRKVRSGATFGRQADAAHSRFAAISRPAAHGVRRLRWRSDAAAAARTRCLARGATTRTLFVQAVERGVDRAGRHLALQPVFDFFRMARPNVAAQFGARADQRQQDRLLEDAEVFSQSLYIVDTRERPTPGRPRRCCRSRGSRAT